MVYLSRGLDEAGELYCSKPGFLTLLFWQNIESAKNKTTVAVRKKTFILSIQFIPAIIYFGLIEEGKLKC